MKGVFGEGTSVVAVPPRPPAQRSPEALSNLFSSDKRAVGNDNEAEARKAAHKNRGLWSDEPLAQKPAPPRPSGLPAAVAGRILAASPWAGKPPSLGAPLPANRNVVEESSGAQPGAEPARPDSAISPARLEPPASRARSESPAVGAARSVELDAEADALEIEPELDAAARGSAQAPAPRRASARPDPDRAAREKARVSAAPIAPAPRLTPLRIVLIACLLLLAAAIVLVGGAFAGLWALPPAAASMLGLESQPAAGERAPGNPRAEQGNSLDAVAPGHAAQAVPQPSAAEPAPNTIPRAEPNAPAPNPNALPAERAPAARERPVTPPGFEPAPEEQSAREPAPVPNRATLASATKLDASTPSVGSPLQPAPGANAASDEQTIEQVTQLARSKLQSGDAAAAETLLRAALDTNPDDHHLLEALVPVLIQQGRAQEAVRYAESIVRKRPRRLAYRLLEAQAKRAAGDRQGAERAYREVLALDPENREAQRQLGSTP